MNKKESKHNLKFLPYDIMGANDITVTMSSRAEKITLPEDIEVYVDVTPGYEVRKIRPTRLAQLANFFKDALCWTMRFGAYSFVFGLFLGGMYTTMFVAIQMGLIK